MASASPGTRPAAISRSTVADTWSCVSVRPSSRVTTPGRGSAAASPAARAGAPPQPTAPRGDSRASSTRRGVITDEGKGASSAERVAATGGSGGRPVPLRTAVGPSLRVEPVARLDEEDVVRVQLYQVARVAAELEARGAVEGLVAPLRPDEEDRGAGAVLPPHHRVRAELLEVEAARVAAGRVGPVARLVLAGPRLVELTPVVVVARGHERLRVHLQRQVGRRREVEARRQARRGLAQPREGVVRGARVVQPLVVVDQVLVVDAERAGEAARRAELYARLDPPAVRVAGVAAVEAAEHEGRQAPPVVPLEAEERVAARREALRGPAAR